ncbi:MAG: hypothetical protein IPM12_14870 [Flavobacteriales bacterium]|nr:hypothetical protein [Flavobacteriales bacterium]
MAASSSKLELPGHEGHALDSAQMPESGTLRDYAEVLARRVNATKPRMPSSAA